MKQPITQFMADFEWDDPNQVWTASLYSIHGNVNTAPQGDGKTMCAALRDLVRAVKLEVNNIHEDGAE